MSTLENRPNFSGESKRNPQLDARVEQKARAVAGLRDELRRVIVGQDAMINRLLIGLFTGGHVLLEGVPGLAKTLTISSLAKALSLDFKRIQFTPDLLPTDLLGTLIYNQRDARFEVKRGPIFANLILADEINRSPAKAQSALLEAMQEKQVTIGDTTYPLPSPFLVLATQNPIDQEGTYPLPEAQVDRFMMKIFVDYPSRAEELQIMRQASFTGKRDAITPRFSAQDVLDVRDIIDHIPLGERLEYYVVDLVMATRKPSDYGLSALKEYIEFGASPRATISLNLASRAHAFLSGRGYVTPDDVKAVAPDVLNHRLLLRYEAEADGVTALSCVDKILKTVPI